MERKHDLEFRMRNKPPYLSVGQVLRIDTATLRAAVIITGVNFISNDVVKYEADWYKPASEDWH